MKIVGLIVTYNRLELLKKTINKSVEFGFDQLVIVNNASSDGTQEYLASIGSENIVILHQTKNIGGAGGFSVGIQYVKDNFIDGWVCLFDDDAYPDSSRHECESVLKEFDDKYAVVASAVFLPDGSISEMNRVGRNPFKTLGSLWQAIVRGREGFHVKDDDYRNHESVEIDTASFVGSFVNIKAVRETNLIPYADLFVYGDDVLYTYLFTQKDYKNTFAPRIRFIHDCKTYGKIVAYEPLWKVYYMYRNGLYVYSKISKIFFPLVSLRYISIWLYRTKYYKSKSKYLKLMSVALFDFLTGNFKRSHADVMTIAGK